jgi:hypothetical protein
MTLSLSNEVAAAILGSAGFGSDAERTVLGGRAAAVRGLRRTARGDRATYAAPSKSQSDRTGFTLRRPTVVTVVTVW